MGLNPGYLLNLFYFKPQFFIKSKIKKQIAAVHERNKPFKCEISNYSYAQKNNIKNVFSVREGNK